jgi:single-stranded-DNA-specific exonuclease
VPGVSIHALLSELREHFVEFGGHAQACGGTVLEDRLDDFRTRAGSLFRERIAEEFRTATLWHDGELPLADASETLAAELDRLEPHGEGNPKPVFVARRVEARGLRTVGERGHRARLFAGGVERRAIAWGLAERWARVGGAPFDVAFHLRRDRAFGGIELDLVDLRPAEP